MRKLEQEAGKATGDARACLESQRRQIGLFLRFLRSEHNWLEAGRYLAPGDGTPDFERSMGEIIDDEIRNTQSLIELVDGHVEELFEDSSNQFRTVYESNDRLIDALRKRVELMKSHRNDKINPCLLPQQPSKPL